MTTQEALLAAIIADPDDNLPRLAYADWCEEGGNLANADFIRSQIADPNLYILANSHDGVTLRWQRGFVCGVICPLSWWLKHGPRQVHQHPLEAVEITDRAPFHHGDSWIWQFASSDPDDPAPEHPISCLPFALYILTLSYCALTPYATRVAAMDGLSRACLTWAGKPRKKRCNSVDIVATL